MIRRQIPKRTDFTALTETGTLRSQRWVNEYPHGILDRRCAGQVLLEAAKEAGAEENDWLL